MTNKDKSGFLTCPDKVSIPFLICFHFSLAANRTFLNPHVQTSSGTCSSYRFLLHLNHLQQSITDTQMFWMCPNSHEKLVKLEFILSPSIVFVDVNSRLKRSDLST